MSPVLSSYTPPAELLALASLPPSPDFDGQATIDFVEEIDVLLTFRDALSAKGSVEQMTFVDEAVTSQLIAFLRFRAEPTNENLEAMWMARGRKDEPQPPDSSRVVIGMLLPENAAARSA